MAISDNSRRPPGNKLPGGIGCLAVLLLVTLIATALGVALGSAADAENKQSDRESAGNVALVPLKEEAAGEADTVSTETALPLATAEPSATVNATATAPATASATSKATASATATEMPPNTPTNTPTVTPSVAPSVAPAEVAIARPTNTAIPPPLPTPRDTYSWTVEVPILMYHYISEPPEDADKYRQDLSVTPEDFREQMTYLVQQGFESIDLYDLSLAITDKVDLPARPIIITVDDGYRDNYENAFPILEELGLTATFFLTTEFMDLENEAYMDWAMIEEMSAAGHRFEPHSKTHPDLTVHDRAYIIWEVQGSRETIAAHIGYLPRYFAYPGGRFNEEVQQIVSELDFWGAVTTLGGSWNGYNDRFEWTRTRIRDVTTLDEFSAMIE